MEEDQIKERATPIGQYYLMEKISQGGMAEIYKGLSYDVHGLKKTVCIKKILPHLSASQEFIASLIDEAKLAVRLVHGNIAQTYDLGKVGDDYFMVMEYVEGKSLSQINKKCVLRSQPLPIPYVVYFISEVLNGLNYMHRRTDEHGDPLHIVHRDISPQNIMVSYSGTVKIIDFGIAKAAFNTASTDVGILKGKFAYMSPEQAMGEAIDTRSDIFSLAVIMHELLTGARLFKAHDSRETIRNVRRARVASPSLSRPEITDELDRIVLKALSKDRRHRYPFASEMHDDLVKFLHRSYPDFKSSDIVQFMRRLFRDEIENPKPIEADSKTPHLIIDRSNSALADGSQFESTGIARAPLDLSEYMLDEPEKSVSPSELSSLDDDLAKPKPIPELEFTGTEETTPAWRRVAHKWKSHVAFGLAVGLVAVVVSFVVRSLRETALPDEKAIASSVMVVTSPGDAIVSLDGVIVGRGSPVTIKNVAPNKEHVLSVEKDGFQTHERILTPRSGEFLSLSIALDLKTLEAASLEITTSPPGATIFIGDHETTKRTPAIIEDVNIGKEFTVGLHLAGYRFWTKKISVKSGETKSFDIQLQRDFGSAFIDSSPQKALVMIDGAPIGQTPLTKDDFDPGKVYKIEIWLEGYSPFQQEIKALAGRKEEIRAILVPETNKPVEGTAQPK